MAREVRRQTLKWKKEQSPLEAAASKSGQAEDQKRKRAEARDGIFCESQKMKIDRSTCIVIQVRKFRNDCIGCRYCGG